jgi:hypothetical protein
MITIVEGSFMKIRIYARRTEGDPSYRYPDETSYVRDLVMETVAYDPSFTDSRFDYDLVWTAEKQREVGADAVQQATRIQFHARLRDVPLYDSDGNKIATVQDVFTSFVREMEKSGSMDDNMFKEFDVPTFVKSSSEVVPFLKVCGLRAHVAIVARAPVEGRMQMANIVRFILRNSRLGTEETFELDTSSNRMTPSAEPAAAADAPTAERR